MIAPNPQPELSVREFFQHTYKPMRMLDAGRGSIQQYEIAITALDRHLKRDSTLGDLTEDNFVALATATLKRKLSPVTVNMRTGHLATLWRFAIRRRLLVDTGEVANLQKLKAPRRLPTAWSEAEMERIVESCRLARGRFSGVPAERFWVALVLVMYDTGLRRTSAFQIRFDELDFANKMLRVPAERMKNLTEQYFRLHDQTIEAILNTLPPTRAQLFPWPFEHHRALYDRYRRILKRAGLPFTKRDMFHKLRRTCASHLARLVGESLAIQQLGHRDAGTIKRYIDPRFTANHDGALLLPRPAWTAPRVIEVEASQRTETKPVEVVKRKFTPEELSGRGDDTFARLVGKPTLDAADVRAILAALGMSQIELAQEIGVSRSTARRVLSGKHAVGAWMSEKIRVAFGLAESRDGRDVLRPGRVPGGKRGQRKGGAA